jgi:hypothetical protein
MSQTPPAPPAPPVAVIAGQQVLLPPSGADPAQVLEAFRQQRSELRDQLERLENQRENLTEQLPGITDAAAKAGILTRIAGIDGRIVAVEKAIADADASVARAAAIPGAVLPDPPEPRREGPPEEFFIFLMVLTVFIGVPLALAYARRIWKKSVTTVVAIPQEIYERFNRIDQAIDSVAVEVERIGEGQRFVTKLVNESRGLGAGAAEPVDAKARSRVEERR